MIPMPVWDVLEGKADTAATGDTARDTAIAVLEGKLDAQAIEIEELKQLILDLPFSNGQGGGQGGGRGNGNGPP
ncbi:MAG: hypothetical protein ACE1Y2_07875 [Stenotrophomonas maltophilia]